MEQFLRSAVKDPHVVAIKMTLYRIGQNSPLIDLLIEAAEAGKQVAVLVELKARFDERNNIIWANRLEEAGIHVVYGLVNLKTHCKLCLVVRQEADGIRRYAHIGTGNYNPETSKIYTDIGLVHRLARGPRRRVGGVQLPDRLFEPEGLRELLVAPVSLRTGIRALIDREIEHAKAGRPARLIFKNNAITDLAMIRALYARVAGRRADRSHRPRRLLPAAGRSRRQRRRSPCGRSSAASWSTRASTTSRTAATPEVVHRQRRPDGAQPGSPRRSALPGHRSRHPAPPASCRPGCAAARHGPRHHACCRTANTSAAGQSPEKRRSTRSSSCSTTTRRTSSSYFRHTVAILPPSRSARPRIHWIVRFSQPASPGTAIVREAMY